MYYALYFVELMQTHEFSLLQDLSSNFGLFPMILYIAGLLLFLL